MEKFLLTVILCVGLILSFNAYSQDTIAESEYEAKHTERIEKRNAIFFAPLNQFDFVNPNFQIGYIRFFAERWAWQIEGGIIINHSIPNYVIDIYNGIKVSECPYTNKGFRLRGSIKYVILDLRNKELPPFLTILEVIGMNFRNKQLYVSPEIFYLKNKSGIVRDFLVSDPDFEYSFGIAPEGMNGYSQFFYNDERKMGVNFKLGFMSFIGKSFYTDFHLGIGFAYRKVIQTGLENPNDELWSAFGIFDNAAPNKWVPTIPLNFKIGFRF